ncbi:hypothetical protein BSLG_001219 [Batrachochytrium salamandrivorans]|nr:hypothetical protein BSLG_005295 [Batrachochytrium salamandrivorans]KAJ1344079.1 hypothetical protein BSLG_001219 [Batrachochytrium salamandrivorans]
MQGQQSVHQQHSPHHEMHHHYKQQQHQKQLHEQSLPPPYPTPHQHPSQHLAQHPPQPNAPLRPQLYTQTHPPSVQSYPATSQASHLTLDSRDGRTREVEYAHGCAPENGRNPILAVQHHPIPDPPLVLQKDKDHHEPLGIETQTKEQQYPLQYQQHHHHQQQHELPLVPGTSGLSREGVSDTPVAAPVDIEDRLAHKRRMNAEAARRCRERKAERMGTLEFEIDRLETINSKLQIKIAVLESAQQAWQTRESNLVSHNEALTRQVQQLMQDAIERVNSHGSH